MNSLRLDVCLSDHRRPLMFLNRTLHLNPNPHSNPSALTSASTVERAVESENGSGNCLLSRWR